MKILLIGSSGFLGHHLFSYLKKDHTIIGTYFKNKNVLLKNNQIYFNIIDEINIYKKLKEIEPDIIISSIAEKTGNSYSAVQCDEFLKGHKILLEYCNKNNTKLVFISTDAVFNGKYGNYSENSKRDPQTDYGIYKMKCEDLIISLLNDHLIIRNGKIDGFFYDHNPTQMQCFYDLALNKKKVYLYNNFFTSRINVYTLCEYIVKAINKNITGILHLGALEKISYYDYFIKMAEIFSFSKEYFIETKLDSIKDSSLNCNRAIKLLDIKLIDHNENLNIIKSTTNS